MTIDSDKDLDMAVNQALGVGRTVMRSTARSAAVRIDSGDTLTVEDGAMIAHSANSTFHRKDDGIVSGLRRKFGGDSFRVRVLTASEDVPVTAEVGASSTQSVLVLHVDSSAGAEFEIGDGAWVAHTGGVEMGLTDFSLSNTRSGERAVMSTASGKGQVVIAAVGEGVLVQLSEGDKFALGPGRLLAHSVGANVRYGKGDGSRMTYVEGPGLVAYQTQSPH